MRHAAASIFELNAKMASKLNGWVTNYPLIEQTKSCIAFLVDFVTNAIQVNRSNESETTPSGYAHSNYQAKPLFNLIYKNLDHSFHPEPTACNQLDLQYFLLLKIIQLPL
jgi:hypothetical protein